MMPRHLGAIYLQLNNPVKALKAFDKALKLEADHGPTVAQFDQDLFSCWGKKDEGLEVRPES